MSAGDGVSFLDEAIVAPIAGDTPAGRDLSYDETFEKVAAEMEKITSVSGDLPDWRFVRRESERMLREDSKDLRVASWWAASAGVLEGWPAIAQAAVTYQAFVERLWEAMFPPLKRVKGRAALAAWLWEQLAKALPTKNVTIADGDAVRAFETAIVAVDALLTERVGDANAGLGALRGVVRERIRSIPEIPKAADPFAGPPPGAAPAAQAAPAQPVAAPPPAIPSGAGAPTVTAVASLEAAEGVADEWRTSLATLAHHAREASPTAPWPYRLARVAAWLTLETPPPVEGGKTFARAPKAGERDDFEAMFSGSAWEALRNACEDALSEHTLWLDLHRWSAIALERSGPPFVAAREAVGRETAALVSRVPGLTTLFFSNGTPFASPETIEWLAEEQAKFGGAGGGGGAGTAVSAADEGPKALLAEAEARVSAGQVDAGLAQAISLANNAANAATRFRAQLIAAEMAHRAGKTDLSLALLERLLPQVDPTLEAWEPEICAKFFETALKVSRAASSDLSSDWVDRQTLLFRRLLQVDPAAALRIG
jgi:type VI secretion system protein VasJ